MPKVAARRNRSRAQIPDAVRSSVLRRVQHLDPVDRAIVMRASVIGHRFDLGVLVAVGTCSEARVRDALERAVRLQLVIEDARACRHYAFRHALTRTILYDEFLAVRVRPLHRRIARALEDTKRAEGAALEDLAYHSWAAGDTGRTLQYNERAGDAAAALHAYESARLHYSRARSLLDVESTAYARLTEKLGALDRA
jgi:predicted ATPase